MVFLIKNLPWPDDIIFEPIKTKTSRFTKPLQCFCGVWCKSCIQVCIVNSRTSFTSRRAVFAMHKHFLPFSKQMQGPLMSFSLQQTFFGFACASRDAFILAYMVFMHSNLTSLLGGIQQDLNSESFHGNFVPSYPIHFGYKLLPVITMKYFVST